MGASNILQNKKICYFLKELRWVFGIINPKSILKERKKVKKELLEMINMVSDVKIKQIGR